MCGGEVCVWRNDRVIPCSAADWTLFCDRYCTLRVRLVDNSPEHIATFLSVLDIVGAYLANKRTADDLWGLLQRARAWRVRQGGRSKWICPCPIVVGPLIGWYCSVYLVTLEEPCDRSRLDKVHTFLLSFLFASRSIDSRSKKSLQRLQMSGRDVWHATLDVW